MKKKNVLFIAYYFPPLAGGGVYRTLKFAKYVREFGYTPIILTVNPRFINYTKDNTLLKELNGIKIIRTPFIDISWFYKPFYFFHLNKVLNYLKNKFLIPDDKLTWPFFAKKAIRKITEKIDLIFITGGPFSSFEIGKYAKEKLDASLILDFRDEWTNAPQYLDLNIPLERKTKELHLEKSILNAADGIVYLTKMMKNNFIRNNNSIANKISEIIPNGYDSEDFAGIQKSNLKKKNEINFLYTGLIYSIREQPFYLFLKAISELIDENKINQLDIKITVVGNNDSSLLNSFTKQEQSILSKRIIFKSYLPKKEALQMAVDTDILLLFIGSGKNAASIYTGKIFEYIASDTPIFGIVPTNGVAADLIRSTKTGIIANPDSYIEIKDKLQYLLINYKSSTLNQDWTEIKKYKRKNQTKVLSNLFDKVLSSTLKI